MFYKVIILLTSKKGEKRFFIVILAINIAQNFKVNDENNIYSPYLDKPSIQICKTN